jgi:serine protease Do
LPQLPEKEVEPVGTAKLIEEILKDLGKDVKLAREGGKQLDGERRFCKNPDRVQS